MCVSVVCRLCLVLFFFFQAEDGIRDLVRSRGLGDVYKRQAAGRAGQEAARGNADRARQHHRIGGRDLRHGHAPVSYTHLTLPTSDLV